MKILLSVVAVLVLLGAIIPTVMAQSLVYHDGFLQGFSDLIHNHFILTSNPTGNPNLTEYMSGYDHGLNSAAIGPFATPLSDRHFS